MRERVPIVAGGRGRYWCKGETFAYLTSGESAQQRRRQQFKLVHTTLADLYKHYKYAM